MNLSHGISPFREVQRISSYAVEDLLR